MPLPSVEPHVHHDDVGAGPRRPRRSPPGPSPPRRSPRCRRCDCSIALMPSRTTSWSSTSITRSGGSAIPAILPGGLRRTLRRPASDSSRRVGDAVQEVLERGLRHPMQQRPVDRRADGAQGRRVARADRQLGPVGVNAATSRSASSSGIRPAAAAASGPAAASWTWTGAADLERPRATWTRSPKPTSASRCRRGVGLLGESRHPRLGDASNARSTCSGTSATRRNSGRTRIQSPPRGPTQGPDVPPRGRAVRTPPASSPADTRSMRLITRRSGR